MQSLLPRLKVCSVIGLVAVVVSAGGCGETAVSRPLDHAMDGQFAVIEAAGGRMEIHLDFARSDITDEQLATLPLPATATSIDLSYTKITNTGLKHLANLTHLEKIRIAGTQISDEGIATLMELDNLWLVDADHSQISRKGQLKLIKFLAPRAQARAVGRSAR